MIKYKYNSLDIAIMIKYKYNSPDFVIMIKYKYNSPDIAIMIKYKYNSPDIVIMIKYKYNSPDIFIMIKYKYIPHDIAIMITMEYPTLFKAFNWNLSVLQFLHDKGDKVGKDGEQVDHVQRGLQSPLFQFHNIWGLSHLIKWNETVVPKGGQWRCCWSW